MQAERAVLATGDGGPEYVLVADAEEVARAWRGPAGKRG